MALKILCRLTAVLLAGLLLAACAESDSAGTPTLATALLPAPTSVSTPANREVGTVTSAPSSLSPSGQVTSPPVTLTERAISNIVPVTEAPPASATPTAPPTASPAAPATATPAPTTTLTVAPATTPAPLFRPSARPVGPANCCFDFSFAGEDRLIYYDKPAGDNRAGAWSQVLNSGERKFLTAGWGSFTPDLKLAALPDRAGGNLHILDLAGGHRLASLPNLAAPGVFSPDGKQLAYLLRLEQQESPEAPQRFEVWVTDVEGRHHRAVWQGRELSGLGWFPDNRRLLVIGRDAANRRFGLWELDLAGSNARLLVESKGINTAALSGDGQWLAWLVTLQGQERSGVWVGRADGRAARKLPWTGGFRWQAAELFYLPVQQDGKAGNSLWSYDPATELATAIGLPAGIGLNVALDQWQIAPGGRQMVYRDEKDGRLWLLQFRP